MMIVPLPEPQVPGPINPFRRVSNGPGRHRFRRATHQSHAHPDSRLTSPGGGPDMRLAITGAASASPSTGLLRAPSPADRG